MEGVVMNRNFWSSKRVLVTGHTGFKGSWLSLWLHELGAEVVGYALEPPSEPNLFGSLGLASIVRHCHGDIRDHEEVTKLFKRHEPEIVFHLAAQSLVRESYRDPVRTYSTNVMGTVHVLEAARQTPSVRVVINVTSDKCYENKEWLWGYREIDPIGGHDPYSSSKGCAELVTAAYTKSFFFPDRYGTEHQVALSSVRAGNVIGGGDWAADRLVPDCIRALSRSEEVVLRNPRAFRPWQHVMEPLRGYLLLAEKSWDPGSLFAGAWNFGPSADESWSVECVVKEMIRLWGSGSYRSDAQGHPHEANQLKLDCSKAVAQLGWRPHYSVLKALEKTVAWYKLFHGGISAQALREFTQTQIRHYASSVGSDKRGIRD